MGGTEDVPIYRSTTSCDRAGWTYHFQAVGAGDSNLIEEAYFAVFEVLREAFLVHGGILGSPSTIQ